MLSIFHPEILPHLAQLVYGLQPLRMPDGSLSLIIKAGKDFILTAKINNTFKIYLVPNIDRPNESLGLICAFFDDHDEPLVIWTPLFADDALFMDLIATLSQDSFDLYFFDELDRELLGATSQLHDNSRFRHTLMATQFPSLNLDTIHDTYAAMTDWFSLRTRNDDMDSFTVSLGERLYPDDIAIIDARAESYGFQSSEERVMITSLERDEPGIYQEQDIMGLLNRVFPSESIFLNPIRDDSGKELADVLIVTDDFLLIVQAKDSPNTEAALRRSIDRKGAVIRAHIEKGARQLRGAIRYCLDHDKLVLRMSCGTKTVPINDRAIFGLVVVREIFDDDYEACSIPVLGVAKEFAQPAILIDYPALHMLARRLSSPASFVSGLFQIFDVAVRFGKYPKPRFTAGPPGNT